MIEIEKRVVKDTEPVKTLPGAGESHVPTVGPHPTVASVPSEGLEPTSYISTPVGTEPTERVAPTVSTEPTVGLRQTVGRTHPNESAPTEGFVPTVGINRNKKVKPIRTVQDALTLAGQVLYKAMLGAGDAPSASCTKGYRQLAAETHLDKDTVRDLIVEFKQKGILHETATYDPDTRLSKTYDVLAPQAVLQAWRELGILFVTSGRQRPLFCSAAGDHMTFIPTVGAIPRH
jgi:hypothetical protein